MVQRQNASQLPVWVIGAAFASGAIVASVTITLYNKFSGHSKQSPPRNNLHTLVDKGFGLGVATSTTTSNSGHLLSTPNSKEHSKSPRQRLVFPRQLQSHFRPDLPPPMRAVVCADAVQWLDQQGTVPGSVLTSLPDHSEMREQMDWETWKTWFVNACALCLSRTPPGSFCIFYQTDVKRIDKQSNGVVEWVDKSYLCHQAAAQTNSRLVWHKIALLTPVDSVKLGRPAYAHVMCFTSNRSPPTPMAVLSQPDVFHRGEMVWGRAIGARACVVALTFLLVSHTHNTSKKGSTDNQPRMVVVDPFCGKGTALALANALGMHAVGVDVSDARCTDARHMTVNNSLGEDADPTAATTESNSNNTPNHKSQKRPNQTKRAAQQKTPGTVGQGKEIGEFQNVSYPSLLTKLCSA